MLTIVLIALFATVTIAAFGTLADSSLRGLTAWRGLRAQLKALDAPMASTMGSFDSEVAQLRPAPSIQAGGSRRAARGRALQPALPVAA